MEEFYELIDLVVTNEVLMGGDFNGDVGSDMDRVFQIVVRGGDWVNSPPPCPVGGELEILLGVGNFYQVVRT